MFEEIISSFGLNAAEYEFQSFGSGLINHTYKLKGHRNSYILQQINTSVFKNPEYISNNITIVNDYLRKKNPEYLFVAPLKAKNGNSLIKSSDGNFYRLFPFIEGSQTFDVLKDSEEAYEAAVQFGRFTHLLSDFDVEQLRYTLPQFHDLKLRFAQFKAALQNSNSDRLEHSANEIKEVYNQYHIFKIYKDIVSDSKLPLRTIHHDTKISNVLFDSAKKALCLVDLDTVMPGYYLSDVGDMMRTYLSPANEEESDLSKISIREDFFSAIYKGYMSEMGGILTKAEKQLFIFSGKLMIYMQALRFLTDYLNNDIYYGALYPEHNLARAKNQFKLLYEYTSAEPAFNRLIIEANNDQVIELGGCEIRNGIIKKS